MYHDVIEEPEADGSGFVGAAAATYKVDPDLFERHLDAIERRVGRPAAQVLDPTAALASAGWLLTFDDGGVSSTTRVADLLDARRWRGAFFVTTDRVGTSGFLTVAQIRELAARGHVIGSHSRSHPRSISSCSREEVRAEWRESVRVLTEMLGAPIVHASVPNGEFSRMVGEEAAAAGIRVLFTSEPTRSWFQIDGCHVVGRYAVRASTSPEWVASVAAGQRRSRYAQWIGWKLKRLAKLLARDRYRRYRDELMSNVVYGGIRRRGLLRGCRL